MDGEKESSPGSSIASLLTQYCTTDTESFGSRQDIQFHMSSATANNQPKTKDNYKYRSNSNNFCRMGTSMEDIRSLSFWKAVLAEFLGTFILVLTSLGACLQGWGNDPLDVVQIALAFGFSVATSVWIIGHVSGGHINPAITIAMLVTRRISLIRSIFYMVAQSVGAIVAAAILKCVTPASQRATLGATALNVGVDAGMGFGIELLITFTLVMTVFATCDSQRKDHGGSFPLSIGIAVSMGHLWAVEFTGSSMNPARSLGPAVVMNIWNDHWVYWIGPMAGGIVAGLLYDNLLASNSSWRKAKDFLLSSRFDDDQYTATSTIEMDDIQQSP